MWDSAGYGLDFLWTRAITWRTGGWQVSVGNTGNTNAAHLDNAAETFNAHPLWWINGGFIGILFGAGNSDCCNYKTDTDGGWFVGKIKAYNANPFQLPEVTAIRKGVQPRNNNKIDHPATFGTCSVYDLMGRPIKKYGTMPRPVGIGIFIIDGRGSAQSAKSLPKSRSIRSDRIPEAGTPLGTLHILY